MTQNSDIVEKVSSVKVNDDDSTYVLVYLKEPVYLTQIEELTDIPAFKKYKVSPGSAFYNSNLDGEKYSLTLFVNNEKHRVSIKAPKDFPGNGEKFLQENAKKIIESLTNKEMQDHTISFIKEKEGDPFMDLAPLSIFTKSYLMEVLETQKEKIKLWQAQIDKVNSRTDKVVNILNDPSILKNYPKKEKNEQQLGSKPLKMK